MTIFISHAVVEERIGFSPSEVEVPAGRERWKRLAVLYRAGLEECGLVTENIVRPEIYQTSIARTVLGVKDGDWHLAVKPPQHLRPFHGIPNVFVFDGWDCVEAAELNEPSPFSDPMIALRQADAILCTTEAAASSLTAVGMGNAIFLLPCLPMSHVPAERRLRDTPDDESTRFGLDQFRTGVTDLQSRLWKVSP